MIRINGDLFDPRSISDVTQDPVSYQTFIGGKPVTKRWGIAESESAAQAFERIAERVLEAKRNLRHGRSNEGLKPLTIAQPSGKPLTRWGGSR